MYQALEQPEPGLAKLRRSAYILATITLLTHTMSITYSLMTFREQSAGFISIIVGSLACYFLSASHLTIYGISILGIMYLKMLDSYYSRGELHYIVALSGAMMLPVWRGLGLVGQIFGSFPGRVHASMVFGTALIALVKFFPLSIENLDAFFVAANSSALTNPLSIVVQTFSSFNIWTLALTVLCIGGLFLLRDRLNQIPLIALLVLVGIIINWGHIFLNHQDLCHFPEVDCKFYLIKLSNMVPPPLEKILMLVPAAAVMTVVLLFEQYLYLEEFNRRGRRFFGEGDLGQTDEEAKVLALANLISGLLGGLPICINMFATYQNFSFNVKAGYRGTKLVGLMQIPVSYAFYSILKWLYQMIPLFILFVIVATPTIYFLSNMLRVHHRHVTFIICLAALNVVTHPIIALILATFISIHDISLLLKATPAEILLQNVDVGDGSRRSGTISHVADPHEDEHAPLVSQFARRMHNIETDEPQDYDAYVLYRFTGAVSYLNYFQHVEEIKLLLDKYVKKSNIPLMLSFRHSQIIDEESLEELAMFVAKLREQDKIRVIFTGLHKKLIGEMEKIPYFDQMLRQDDKSMYRLDAPNE